MPTLPLLKTGAVTQYPAGATRQYRNNVYRYVDGAEQRYREHRGPLREWAIRLDLLDESELAALDEFFQTQNGQFGSFAFVDPHDQTSYPDCSLAADELEVELAGELRGRTTFVVRENRS